MSAPTVFAVSISEIGEVGFLSSIHADYVVTDDLDEPTIVVMVVAYEVQP